MYNKSWVIAGLIFFLFLVTFPFWKKIIATNDATSQIPQPVLAAGLSESGAHCIEDRAFMRAKHMILLNEWRNEAVRHNKKIYKNSRGEEFKKSLTGTCLKCHSNKEEFCDTCHKSVGAHPYCFDCHFSNSEILKDKSTSLDN